MTSKPVENTVPVMVMAKITIMYMARKRRKSGGKVFCHFQKELNNKVGAFLNCCNNIEEIPG